MSEKTGSAQTSRQWRQMSSEFRQNQLIEATIDVISEVGIAQTTVSKVGKRAGLSPAVINLQFDTKENLLTATFTRIRSEYLERWREVVARDIEQSGTMQQIRDLLNIYFLPEICTPKKLKVWFAFLGSAPSRPTYLKITDGYDDRIVGGLSDVIEKLPEMAPHTKQASNVVARSLLAACEGLWLARMLRPHTLSPKECMKTIDTMLKSYFPDHY
jgi:TetR/AcrR family transcriptional repressor of bet genes